MPDIEDGAIVEVKGSARDPYVLKNTGGVYSCNCPAWRNQSIGIEQRTCKHLRQYRGEEAESERLGGELPERVSRPRTARESGSIDGSVDSSEPGLLLAHPWKNDIDLTGWWMSEKLDGVRAYWDGRQFISRQGNVFLAPEWFTDELPADIPLDGELWLDRKEFQRTVSIVRRQDRSDAWKDISYVVFDAPAVDDVFEARIAFLQEFLDERQPRYAQPHLQVRCQGLTHLKEELARVEALGGEGLMMRKPASKYEIGRSFSLLKVKTFHDAEARVIEHLPGTGKHSGRLGALVVELDNGTRFSVGTGFTDAERENPPAIGSLITFSYQELSDRGVPRFPSYLRLRPDNIGAKPTTVSLQTAAAASSSPARTSITSSISSNTTGSAGSSQTTAPADPSPPSPPTVLTAPKPHPSGGSCLLGPRYFEFIEGTSSKFWEIKVIDSQVIVRFGRIGTDGLVKPKAFATSDSAIKYALEVIEEKVEKGYEESDRPDANLSEDSDDDDEDESERAKVYAKESVRPEAPSVTNINTKQSTVAITPGSSSATDATSGSASSAPAPAPALKLATAGARTPSGNCALGPRLFQFDDGSSSKFWEVKVIDKQVIVRFGKIGTDGQVKPKPFPSADAALKYAERIIEEKVGKGYEEVDSHNEILSEEDEDDEDIEAGKPSRKISGISDSSDRKVAQPSPAPLKLAAQPPVLQKAEDEEEEEEDDDDASDDETGIAPDAKNERDDIDEASSAASTTEGERPSFGPNYLQLDDKFWEIKVIGKNVFVRTGSTGTPGQSQRKPFPSENAAVQYAQAMLASKLRQGFVQKS